MDANRDADGPWRLATAHARAQQSGPGDASQGRHSSDGQVCCPCWLICTMPWNTGTSRSVLFPHGPPCGYFRVNHLV